MDALAFDKMHGLGNDAVVIDARERRIALSAEQIRRLADRRRGIGFDQLIMLEPSSEADVFMRIFNADGGEVEACGNATRCVARKLLAESRADGLEIATMAGILRAARDGHGGFVVDMGRPRLEWHEIPLAEVRDTLHLGIEADGLADPVAVNMGNPHAVFFVEDVEAVLLEHLGPKLEHHPLFPERANVGVCQVLDQGMLRLRVWERGAGLTMACGSGACAALVAAVRRGLAEREAVLRLDGGNLRVRWDETGSVVMSGPAAWAYSGRIAPELLGQ